MGSNAEIRSRMEIYRKVLLALVWIGVIVGFVMMGSRYTASFGIPVIIFAVIGGIIGHFLVNVALAIPFILLNNGDILSSLVGKGSFFALSSSGNRTIVGNKIQKKCKRCHKR